ncbi:MAG: hypothetical protein ACREGI_04075, partial [Candidatus Levyibacteriota bacterium]
MVGSPLEQAKPSDFGSFQREKRQLLETRAVARVIPIAAAFFAQSKLVAFSPINQLLETMGIESNERLDL